MVNARRLQCEDAGSETVPRIDHEFFDHVGGVDFSGAARAGRTAWLAEMKADRSPCPLHLHSLHPIGHLAGDDRREAVCQYLVDRILGSEQTLWGLDFPFGLPIELCLGPWPAQLRQLARFDGGARDYGLELVARTVERIGAMHVRRQTDRETRTPFDCYHYRIIYQTFHGIRDVLRHLARDRLTAVLPFQYPNCRDAGRIVVEACPSSTLQRLGLPHRLYKQTRGREPDTTHRRTRQQILRGIEPLVTISAHRRRVIMRDPGGDALDAVLAGIGSWLGVRRADHRAIAADHRYPAEGYVFC